MNVGVVGLGLIGGSLLRALGAPPAAGPTGSAGPTAPAGPTGPTASFGPTGSAGPTAPAGPTGPTASFGPTHAVGFDADPATRAAAAADGFTVADDLGGLRGCDLVLVAVPPAATAEVVRAALELAPVVADTASVKAPVAAAVTDERFVAAHPLAGAEAAGWAAASPEILRGAPWAVCSGSSSALCALSGAVDRLGGHLVPCTPRDHDAAVARTSHVPHVVAQALARTVEGDPLRAALTGGSFRDMTRVARADPQLWGDILRANRDAVLEALGALDEALEAHRAALAAGDPARAWRAPAAPAPLDWQPVRGGWDDMLGRRVRRLRAEGGEIAYEVAA